MPWSIINKIYQAPTNGCLMSCFRDSERYHEAKWRAWFYERLRWGQDNTLAIILKYTWLFISEYDFVSVDFVMTSSKAIDGDFIKGKAGDEGASRSNHFNVTAIIYLYWYWLIWLNWQVKEF